MFVLLLTAGSCSKSGKNFNPRNPVGTPVVAGSLETRTPRLTVRRGTFRDPLGRAVFLRGVNYSHRTKTKPFVEWQRPEHFQQIRDLGFNCVRYLVLWEAIEPQPGVIDTQYLDHVERAIGWAEEAGLYVVVDMHQDIYSALFGGDGAPAWATIDLPQTSNAPKDPWFLTYLLPDVMASFHRFWNDAQLQGHYANAWKAVVERSKNFTNVVGYDLMNEPFPGPDLPWAFEGGNLSSFYATLTAEVRSVDPAAIVFIEPAAVTANEGLTSSLKAPPGPVVYAPHFYDPMVLMRKKYLGKILAGNALGVMKAQSDDMGAPLFIGEFGCYRDTPEARDVMKDQCDVMDEILVAGWAYWNFNPDVETNTAAERDTRSLVHEGVEHPGMDSFLRPYPVAIAGDPVAMSFHLEAKLFRLTIRNANPAVPTEIHLPQRHYPTVTVKAPGRWELDPVGRTLKYFASGSDTETITVRP